MATVLSTLAFAGDELLDHVTLPERPRSRGGYRKPQVVLLYPLGRRDSCARLYKLKRLLVRYKRPASIHHELLTLGGCVVCRRRVRSYLK
jgi:hypothetical protein